MTSFVALVGELELAAEANENHSAGREETANRMVAARKSLLDAINELKAENRRLSLIVETTQGLMSDVY